MMIRRRGWADEVGIVHRGIRDDTSICGSSEDSSRVVKEEWVIFREQVFR